MIIGSNHRHILNIINFFNTDRVLKKLYGNYAGANWVKFNKYLFSVKKKLQKISVKRFKNVY